MQDHFQTLQHILSDLQEVNRLIAAFNDDMDNLMLDNYRQRKHILLQELMDVLKEFGVEREDLVS